MDQEAAKRAKIRAASARWDLNVALVMIAVMTGVIILSWYDVRVEIVGQVAILGLTMAWLIGWRRGKQLYQYFYDEELSNLEQNLIKWGMLAGREHNRHGDSEDAA